MVVARNCRRRRSPAASSSSPTSLMLPPVGASDPFCNSPITVSDVTDLPEPLSPTTHSVSPSLTLSEMPSMTRGPCAVLPRLTTRSLMSRTTFFMSSLSQHRHCEERSDEAIHSFFLRQDGLLRFARNDVERSSLLARNDDETYSLASLPLLHAGIERVAGGVADQVDAENRDREQEARPEDQRRLDLKIG